MRSIVIALVIVAGFAGAYYLGLRKRASRLNAFARHLRRSLRAGSVCILCLSSLSLIFTITVLSAVLVRYTLRQGSNRLPIAS